MVDAFSNKGSIEKDEFPPIFHLPNEVCMIPFSYCFSTLCDRVNNSWVKTL